MKGKINEACEDLSCIIYDMDRRVVKRTQTTNMQEKMKLWEKKLKQVYNTAFISRDIGGKRS